MNVLRSSRGVSLIEALVALAAMAFGLLGVVGMQSTMRFSSDVSKQRSEAVRMAQEQVESLRSFNALAGTPDFDYAEIASVSAASVTVPTGFANTDFTITTTVTDPAADAPQFKTVEVEVSWLDRRSTGTPNQSVKLLTTVAGVSPELGATLSLPGDRAAPARPRGLHPTTPPGAVASGFGDGRSLFSPPGAGTRTWIFNNVTGQIERVCSAAPADSTYTDCATVAAQLLSGYVNFSTLGAPSATAPTDTSLPTGHTLGIQMTTTTSPTPAAAPECYTQVVPSPFTVAYFCLVPTRALAPNTWSGRSEVTLINTSTSTSAIPGTYKICRYTPEATHSPAGSNAAHPLDYVGVARALINQNFLVIGASHSCPADLTPPGLGNTFPHQPSS
jgi:Tfp pilus assembly protein PilV